MATPPHSGSASGNPHDAGQGAQPTAHGAPTVSEIRDSEEGRIRWAFLAEASRCLADSLEYETTLETVAGLALPLLGSWSIVDLTEPGGSVRRLTIVHPDPEKQGIARELKEGWPPRRDDPMGVPAVARTFRSELIPEITDGFLVKVARNDENLRRLRALGMTSLVTVPMLARGRILGAITLISSSESRRYTEADLDLAEDLADRCALAIDNARLHRAAHALAETEVARLRAEATGWIKSEFLVTASHELRTPLNVMAGYLELLAMEIAGPLTTTQRKYVERVQTGERQLLRIVEDMLNFVRLYTQEIEYDLADVALHRVIRDVSETYRQDLEEKGLEFEVQCEHNVCAHTDPAKVWQILINLLSNARKFTDPGGKIKVECGMAEGSATIRVIDTGCGIPLEKLDSVFEPYVQADAGLTRRAQGMGLGLSISRHLARGMGGDLTVTSTMEEGCIFTVSLLPAREN